MEPVPPIPFEGSLSFPAYRRGRRLAMRPVTRALTWTIVAMGALGLFGLVVTLALPGVAFDPLILLAPAGLLAYLGLGHLLVEHRIRASWRDDEALREPFSGILSADAFEATSSRGTATIPWTRFERWCADDEVLVLFRSRRSFTLLARELFETESHWQAARDLIAERVGTA